ncbi:hypothetical protein Tco_0976886 [Tanacetum coccineum]|uniref:Uncharacterized protein n=1 Tax=Tanacetum coccineum TaxID=301880 RepID=A0ABQ5EIM0_9ASTR
MIIKKDSRIVNAKVERKSPALKAKKEFSDEECSTFGSEEEEYAMAMRHPNHLIKECPKPPKDKNQRAFVGGSWSDSGEEDDEKVKNKTCLVAQASSEICLGVDLELNEWIKLTADAPNTIQDKLKACSQATSHTTKGMLFLVESLRESTRDGKGHRNRDNRGEPVAFRLYLKTYARFSSLMICQGIFGMAVKASLVGMKIKVDEEDHAQASANNDDINRNFLRHFPLFVVQRNGYSNRGVKAAAAPNIILLFSLDLPALSPKLYLFQINSVFSTQISQTSVVLYNIMECLLQLFNNDICKGLAVLLKKYTGNKEKLDDLCAWSRRHCSKFRGEETGYTRLKTNKPAVSEKLTYMQVQQDTDSQIQETPRLPDDEIVDPRVKVKTVSDYASSPPRNRRKHLGVRSDDCLWDKPIGDGEFPPGNVYIHIYYQQNRWRKYFTYLKQLLPHVYREDILLLRRRMNSDCEVYVALMFGLPAFDSPFHRVHAVSLMLLWLLQYSASLLVFMILGGLLGITENRLSVVSAE